PTTNLIDVLISCPNCSSTPVDKRTMISMGPFDMQPGESQEVYVAACVGQSRPTSDNTGNLRASGEVRYIATVAQNLFDRGFGFQEDALVESLPSVPSRYSLAQNYPNPFNPITTIKYELPEDVIVSLQVYDMAGRKVAVLVDKQAQKAGVYEAKLEASRLASGVYLYRLKAGPYFKTRKLVVVK
ncbi:MAG: T9SS type A sorting domain-containing protein, partial [Rhizobacter sp.]|nr:T9SS type A sorting domain-containing protein [Chlorobiales bacterium]